MTGLRLSSANISLERVDQRGHGTMSTNARATFDRNGDFQIPGVSPGSYSVFVRAAGEESFEMVVPAMKIRDFHFSEVTKF